MGRASSSTQVPTVSRGEKAGTILDALAQALGEEPPRGTGALLEFSWASLGVEGEGAAFFCLLGVT